MRTFTTPLLFLLFAAALAAPSVADPLAQARSAVSSATVDQKAAWLRAIALEGLPTQSTAGPRRFGTQSVLFQTCSGVGYVPSRFADKPDPWPGNLPLPNDELLTAYIARYGVPPGSDPTRIGYCCELFGANEDALDNAHAAGVIGTPRGDCSTTTEQVDLSFTEGRGGVFYGTWWWGMKEGGSADHPIIDPTKPCGLTSERSPIGYPLYYLNNSTTCTTPPPVCGNGILEAGETCNSCPADAGSCAPVCGNGVLEAGETCTTCPADAGDCAPVYPSCQTVPATVLADVKFVIDQLGANPLRPAARRIRSTLLQRVGYCVARPDGSLPDCQSVASTTLADAKTLVAGLPVSQRKAAARRVQGFLLQAASYCVARPQ